MHYDDERFNMTLENEYLAVCVWNYSTGIWPTLAHWVCHDPEVTSPTASTCSLTLTRPTTIADIDIFKKRITYAIFNTVGFGHVWLSPTNVLPVILNSALYHGFCRHTDPLHCSYWTCVELAYELCLLTVLPFACHMMGVSSSGIILLNLLISNVLDHILVWRTSF